MPFPPHSSWFDHPNNTWWGVQTTKLRRSIKSASLQMFLFFLRSSCTRSNEHAERHTKLSDANKDCIACSYHQQRINLLSLALDDMSFHAWQEIYVQPHIKTVSNKVS
jgi:DNA replicative helicase MCM subunit Mcm2 (Cdc46/Mcm family)